MRSGGLGYWSVIGVESAVILLSGGVGSAVAACRQAGESALYPLFIDYGRASGAEERSAASALAEALNVRLTVLDLPHVRQVAKALRSRDPGEDRPGRLELGGPSEIAGLTTTLLSIGAEYAAAVGARSLITGHSAPPLETSGEVLSRERSVDPRELHYAFGIMLEAALPSVRSVKLDAPLIGLQPFEVVKLGSRFGVPFERTWTCHRTAPPCGACSGCKTRTAAFGRAGLVDALPQTAGT